MELTIDQALQEGVAAHRAGKLQEAEKYYNAILKSQPDHPDANHNLGVLGVGVGKIELALPYFKKAVESNSKVEQYWVSYIDALIKLDQLDDAKQIFQQAQATGLKGEKLDQLGKRLGVPSDDLAVSPPKHQMERLASIYRHGNLQGALDLGKALAIDFPKDSNIFYIVGGINKALGNSEESINNYNKAIELRPNFPEAYNNIGSILNKLGKHEEAAVFLKNAVNVGPSLSESYYNLAIALNALGQYKEAVKGLIRAIALRPTFPEAYNNLGTTLRVLGQLEESILSYQKAVATRVNFPEAYNNMGATFKELEQYKDAVASFTKALELRPPFEEASYNLGLLFSTMNRYSDAIKNFQSIDFKNSKSYLLRCYLKNDDRIKFFQLLDQLIHEKRVEPMIGALVNQSALKYQVQRLNLFCKNPLNYVQKTDLKIKYDFEEVFQKKVKAILNDRNVQIRKQSLLKNGYQTHGNLFELQRDLMTEMQKVIRLELENYKNAFKGSEEGLFTHWPANYDLYGWLICMKSGGELKPHMHEKGWISGSIYINVPRKVPLTDGNLVVCVGEDNVDSFEKQNIDVETGSLCFFPASLYHYTIPFSSSDERIVLAFDVIPTGNSKNN